LRANIFYYNLIFFNTNKQTYYYDESMEINALWDLNYDGNQEISYMQIQICDDNEFELYNSSKFYEIGLNIKNWTIKIQKLDFDFINSSYTLFINAYNYYKNLNVGDPELTLLESIKVDIIKRNISCEITGYKSNIKYGDKLAITAQFFYLDNESYLSNESVEFKIISNKNVIYKDYYTTNFSGKISLYISSIKHLNLGQNSLIFNISKRKFFNECQFLYNVKVEKYQIFAEIISFKNKIHPNEDIDLQLLYYYYNNTIYPLMNSTINVAIYVNWLLKYEANFKTNNSGLLKVQIIHDFIEFNEDQNDFLLNLYFNGSDFLQNFTLSLSMEIISVDQLNLFAIEISIGSLTTSLFMGVLVLVYKKRKAKNKLLKDISFKY
ncbi:MAG: hypothetical protein ACFFFB_21455, partial [Candidatus Heimdallarchaeota archaeon]